MTTFASYRILFDLDSLEIRRQPGLDHVNMIKYDCEPCLSNERKTFAKVDSRSEIFNAKREISVSRNHFDSI